MTARIYTVPPGVPFLSAIARAVLNGDLPQPGSDRPTHLKLADVTLLLPTRRAARAAQDAFLAASGAKALLMPRIRPISSGDEEGGLIAGLANDTAPDALDVPPAISPLYRVLTLMQLIHHWQKTKAQSEKRVEFTSQNTAAQAVSLAADLAGLMDEVERENVPLSGIAALVPEDYAAHWTTTVEFLKIVTEHWPAILKSDGFISPEMRRNEIILNEAQRIAGDLNGGPVIVAGVTGSIPATATLMRAVLARPNGVIVLPALDTLLDTGSWDSIVPGHPEHPQFGLIQLLQRLGLKRSDVAVLPGIPPDDRRDRRNAIISEVMRPSSSTDRWHDFIARTPAQVGRTALEGLHLIEAPSAHDEAEAVALILRQAVETPGRTAALVSPDRLLARRVAIRLEAWGIRVDDSAGRPFAKTVPGTFLNLVIDAAGTDFAPAETMALLKHPLCRLGLNAFDARRFARALEILVFRAPYLGKGLGGLSATLEKRESDRSGKSLERLNSVASRLWDEDRQGAQDLVARLRQAFVPLLNIFNAQKSSVHLGEIAKAHAETAEALSAVPSEELSDNMTGNRLWQGEAGQTAQHFFASLLAEDAPAVSISAAEYPDLYRGLLARENVRERAPVHPRVSIWGPFEARLQHADVMILGSLNEGTWPEAAEPGAWLNRPMRAELGLPQPEQDIGRAAHDFATMLGANDVILTRAQKVNGVPTVPSRWLMRLTALLGGLGLEDALTPELPWLDWAGKRNEIVPGERIIIKPPEPCPPLALRPRKMSVTRVEDWLANPYSVFARNILNLEALPHLALTPDTALRGALIHEVLAQFSSRHPSQLPNNVVEILDEIARSVLQSYTGHAKVAAFWLPRLTRFLKWFAETEPERRAGVKQVIAETSGSLVVAAPAGPFVLTARADRIDERAGGLVLIDYKTGTVPTAKSVIEGWSPQLPLEAAIALGETGFPGLNGRPVQSLVYIRASGGDPPGSETHIKHDNFSQLAEVAKLKLEEFVAMFDKPDQPYRALRRPGFNYDYDDYAHLARVAEWAADGTADSGEDSSP